MRPVTPVMLFILLGVIALLPDPSCWAVTTVAFDIGPGAIALTGAVIAHAFLINLLFHFTSRNARFGVCRAFVVTLAKIMIIPPVFGYLDGMSGKGEGEQRNYGNECFHGVSILGCRG